MSRKDNGSELNKQTSPWRTLLGEDDVTIQVSFSVYDASSARLLESKIYGVCAMCSLVTSFPIHRRHLSKASTKPQYDIHN
jgi:hypothetical protein